MAIIRFKYRRTNLFPLSLEKPLHKALSPEVKVNITPKFRQAMQNLLTYSNGETGLIMRWNNDDSTIETVWSEGYKTIENIGQVGSGRASINRLENTYDTSKSQPDIGGHAEEILIRTWDYYKKTLGIYPTSVDIILTHSPCRDVSGVFRDAKGTVWPCGCANKLYKLINEIETNVKIWNIGYFAYYGTAASTGKAIEGVAKLQSHPRVLTYYFHGVP
jgi:hypothetical protein